MSDIFISYASEDTAFAQRLASDLQKYFGVWIDQRDIAPGVLWEQKIDEGIGGCKLFLVVVSEASNNSDWVRRERIRAENLKKYRIPILLSAELPLGLLELQYIDFRADYEGGLFDLLAILNTKLHPKDPMQGGTEVDTLLGRGIRAYLQRTYSTANALIGQALILEKGLAKDVDEFWQRLGSRPTPLADELIQQIATSEVAKRTDEVTYPEGRAFRWSVEIDTTPQVLALIDYVKYTLHQSFADPERTIRTRDNRFKLETIGWGTFPLQVEIHFIDGSVGHLIHQLTFKSALGQP